MKLLLTAHNRLEFTRAVVKALLENTDWSLVDSVSLYDDASVDGTSEFLRAAQFPVTTKLKRVEFRSPVACMNDFIITEKPDLFAKIDNDTMVPPGWLGECISILNRNPRLDLLGIEAMHAVSAEAEQRGIAIAESHIGGIGLMRGRAFQYSLPRPDGRFGFTAWQDSNHSVMKAWIKPALPVFLLDRVPLQPWCSLSGAYVAKQWQRAWPPYSANDHARWEWWKP